MMASEGTDTSVADSLPDQNRLPLAEVQPQHAVTLRDARLRWALQLVRRWTGTRPTSSSADPIAVMERTNYEGLEEAEAASRRVMADCLKKLEEIQ